MKPSISIIIPTQRRPRPLQQAARSAMAQKGVDAGAIELVIVDNDAIPTAKPVVDALRALSPYPVVYVHEPRAGVAYARNAAMTAASGDLISFNDDVFEAPQRWLAALHAVQ